MPVCSNYRIVSSPLCERSLVCFYEHVLEKGTKKLKLLDGWLWQVLLDSSESSGADLTAVDGLNVYVQFLLYMLHA